MKNVAIVLFDRIEILDFAGPYEVFSVCGAHGEHKGHFNVYTVAEKAPVIGRGGLSINPDYLFNDCPTPDIFLVPGGGGYTDKGVPFGSRKEMHNPVMLDWVKKQNETASLVLSVCTGALILGKAGILDGLAATTHWKAIDQLRDAAPNAKIIDDKRWVDNGRVILSAGVSAGIDMSLYVLEKLMGKAVASETARSMQYDHWQ
jgi:transcriptional regulator GlxA family with amidase domain